MILTIIYVAVLIAGGVFIFDTVRGYRSATGTTWERLKAAFQSSLTIAWSRLNLVSVGLVWVVTQASDWMGVPGVKDAVSPYLTPGYLLAYTLVVLVGSELARRRTLS